MKQLARNLTDDMNGFLNGYRYLLRDWARVFSEEFRMVLQAAGVETVRLPARSPNLNAFAERFVRSIMESCLERLILIGEKFLRHCLENYVAQFHSERSHQDKDHVILFPVPADRVGQRDGPLWKRERLGVLPRCYYREAA